MISEADRIYANFVEEIQSFISSKGGVNLSSEAAEIKLEPVKAVLKSISRDDDVTMIVLEYVNYPTIKPLREIMAMPPGRSTQDMLTIGSRLEVIRFHHGICWPLMSIPEIFPLQLTYDGHDVLMTEAALFSFNTGIIPVDIATIDMQWRTKIKKCLTLSGFHLWFPGLDEAKTRQYVESLADDVKCFDLGQIKLRYLKWIDGKEFLSIWNNHLVPPDLPSDEVPLEDFGNSELLDERPRWKIVDPRQLINRIETVKSFYPPGLWNGLELTLEWELKRIVLLAKFKPQDDCPISRLPLDIVKLVFKHLDLLIIDDIKADMNAYMAALYKTEEAASNVKNDKLTKILAGLTLALANNIK